MWTSGSILCPDIHLCAIYPSHAVVGVNAVCARSSNITSRRTEHHTVLITVAANRATFDGDNTSTRVGLSKSCRHTRVCIIGKITHRTVSTTAIDVMQNDRRTSDINRSVTFDIACYFITDFTFTTTINVAIFCSALISSTNRTASNIHFSSVTICSVAYTRLFTTSINTFGNGSGAIDSKSCLACHGTKSCEVFVSIEDVICVIHP